MTKGPLLSVVVKIMHKAKSERTLSSKSFSLCFLLQTHFPHLLLQLLLLLHLLLPVLLFVVTTAAGGAALLLESEEEDIPGRTKNQTMEHYGTKKGTSLVKKQKLQ